jgi:hypothetical protein
MPHFEKGVLSPQYEAFFYTHFTEKLNKLTTNGK